ncbi:hypothetical protein, partial [Roseburia sp. 1XD42-69]|uniref:hypothetical protein n=1 Tax=Roseburia sp. 1XD42-69 TaxID=2320088 RepID=UPI000EDEDB15
CPYENIEISCPTKGALFIIVVKWCGSLDMVRFFFVDLYFKALSLVSYIMKLTKSDDICERKEDG